MRFRRSGLFGFCRNFFQTIEPPRALAPVLPVQRHHRDRIEGRALDHLGRGDEIDQHVLRLVEEPGDAHGLEDRRGPLGKDQLAVLALVESPEEGPER